MLGLAKRAGKLAVGYDAAVTAVKTKKAFLTVCANDLSPKTIKEWHYATNQQALLILPLEKEALGAALGIRKPAGLIAICDEGFANAIQKLCSIEKEDTK